MATQTAATVSRSTHFFGMAGCSSGSSMGSKVTAPIVRAVADRTTDKTSEEKKTMKRLCQTHPEHNDDCLDCAIDRALDQSPDGNSMFGLARLIPGHLRNAYFERIVSGTMREIRAEAEAAQ